MSIADELKRAEEALEEYKNFRSPFADDWANLATSLRHALADLKDAIEESGYEYGTQWTLSEEAHGPGKRTAVYPCKSLEEAQEEVATDMTASGSSEPRGKIVRRTAPGEWEELT